MKISQLIQLLEQYKKELGDVDSFEALYGTSLASRLMFGATKKVYKKGITHDLTYGTWVAMHKRCFDPNHEAYPKYGGSGISICHRWLKYENFLQDMGERPSKEITLDRINPKKATVQKIVDGQPGSNKPKVVMLRIQRSWRLGRVWQNYAEN